MNRIIHGFGIVTVAISCMTAWAQGPAEPAHQRRVADRMVGGAGPERRMATGDASTLMRLHSANPLAVEKAKEEPKNPLYFEMEIGAAADSNALGDNGGGKDDVHLDWYAYVEQRLLGDDQTSLNMTGTFAGSRYDEFDANDYLGFFVGPYYENVLTARSKLTLSSIVLWSYDGELSGSNFTRNRTAVSLSCSNNIDAIKMPVFCVPSIMRDTYNGDSSGNNRFGVTVRGKRSLSSKIGISFETAFFQVDNDDGGDYAYSESTVGFPVKIAAWGDGEWRLVPSVYYFKSFANGNDDSVDQFQAVPKIFATRTF